VQTSSGLGPVPNASSAPKTEGMSQRDRGQGDLADVIAETFSCNFASAIHICDSCGDSHPISEMRVYRSCGVVARCPNCDTVAVVVSYQPEVDVGRLGGLWSLPH